MDQRIYNFLGLAQRAGQVSSGEAAADAVVKKGKAKLVLVAADAAEKTKDYFITLAEQKKIPWIECGRKTSLGAAIGKSPRSVAVITEENFARKLKHIFDMEGMAY